MYVALHLQAQPLSSHMTISFVEFNSIVLCGNKAFQVYFDDAKNSSQESRVVQSKQVSRIKESFNQSKFQESKSRSIKIQEKTQDMQEI